MLGRVLCVALLVALAPVAYADRAADLGRAEALLGDGQAGEAAAAADELLGDPSLTRGEQAQAQRLRGLALFALDRREDAELAFRAYLQLEPDAHLDPALVPPETVVFFEGVRSRYAGEVLIAKPRPKKRRYLALNFLPPLGQLQNGDRTKAFVIAGIGVAFLAANIGTYVTLRNACSTSDLTCTGDPSARRTLKTVNLASGAAVLGLYAYAVIDGLIGYSSASQGEARKPWSVAPISGWGSETLGLEAAFSF